VLWHQGNQPLINIYARQNSVGDYKTATGVQEYKWQRTKRIRPRKISQAGATDSEGERTSDDVFRRKVEEERAFPKAADMGTVNADALATFRWGGTVICTDVAFACDPIKFPDMFTGSYIYENHIFKPSQGRISLRQFGEVVCQVKGEDRT